MSGRGDKVHARSGSKLPHQPVAVGRAKKQTLRGVKTLKKEKTPKSESGAKVGIKYAVKHGSNFIAKEPSLLDP